MPSQSDAGIQLVSGGATSRARFRIPGALRLTALYLSFGFTLFNL